MSRSTKYSVKRPVDRKTGKPKKNYYVFFYDRSKGYSVSYSCQTPDLEEADVVAAQLYSEYVEGLSNPSIKEARDGGAMFSTVLVAYIEYLGQSELSEVHIDQTIRIVQGYLASPDFALAGLPIEKVTTSVIAQFRVALKQKNKSTYSINRILQTLSAVLAFAVDSGVLAVAPKVRKLPYNPSEVGKALDHYHLRRLLAAARSCTSDPYHNLALFWYVGLCALCGLRPKEARSVRWEWVEWTGDGASTDRGERAGDKGKKSNRSAERAPVLRFPVQKNKSFMRAPLGGIWKYFEKPPVRGVDGELLQVDPVEKRTGLIVCLYEVINGSLDVEPKNVGRFQRTWPRILRRACRGRWKGRYETKKRSGDRKAIKIKVYDSPYRPRDEFGSHDQAGNELHNLREHDLRHTFCTMVYRRTNDIKTAMTLTRHKSFASASRYIHLRDEDVFGGMSEIFGGGF